MPVEELRLLKKKKKGVFAILFSRTGIILALFTMAVLMYVIVSTYVASLIFGLLGGVGIFNFIVIIAIINSDMDSSAKLTWILIVSATSIFGTLFYLYTRADIGSKAVGTGYNYLTKAHKGDLVQDTNVLEKLKVDSCETAELVEYLNRSGSFPATCGNDITYYPSGEAKWKAVIKDLENAKDFIFLEYFVLEEGVMWGTILNILKKKAEEGIEVRVLYDGTCAIKLLPYNYPKLLEANGIKCKMFSPIRPFLSTHYNYRDHRKIMVIDGKIGFNGGVNLADEYINQKEKYGHWKDAAIRIEGEAVKNMTLMFLNMWSLGEKEPEYKKYIDVLPIVSNDKEGYVIPYGDSPFDADKVGEKVYMDMLNRANNYVHIMTPYLILDDVLLGSLKFAAERGVDVRIILPGIPDKKAVYALAKTYFKTLLDSGIKIYLYKPGFVHAKVFVSDDVKAVVGTINLDYRSLYHHFECGTYMYGTECIEDIENDFEFTLNKCKEVTYEQIKREKVWIKLLGKITRLVAPLL